MTNQEKLEKSLPLPKPTPGKLPYSVEKSRDIATKKVDINTYGKVMKNDIKQYAPKSLKGDITYQYRMDGIEKQVVAPSGSASFAKRMKDRG